MLGAIRAGDAVMVKASNGSKMGPLVKALQRRYPQTAASSELWPVAHGHFSWTSRARAAVKRERSC